MKSKFFLHYNKNNRPHVKITRTKTGTIIEVVALVMVVIMWAVVLTVNPRPTLNIPILGTLLTGFFLVCAYHPRRTINLPFEIKNERQLVLMSDMVREMALPFPVLMLGVALDSVGINPAGKILLVLSIVVLVIVSVIDTWRIYNA